MQFRHIAIEGPIGAGKTELAERLGARLDATTVLDEAGNPFLADFYAGRPGAALQAQLFYLLNRHRQQTALRQSDLFTQMTICDYLFDKDKIFAYLNLEDDELKLYETLLASVERHVPTPDLVVYIQASNERLMANIRERGRPFEKNISGDYIRDLNEAYNYFFFRYKAAPLLIVNATHIDFVRSEKHYEDLLMEIFRENRAPVEYYNPPSEG